MNNPNGLVEDKKVTVLLDKENNVLLVVESSSGSGDGAIQGDEIKIL